MQPPNIAFGGQQMNSPHDNSHNKQLCDERIKHRTIWYIANQAAVALYHKHLQDALRIVQNNLRHTVIGWSRREHRHLNCMRQELVGIKNEIDAERHKKQRGDGERRSQPLEQCACVGAFYPNKIYRCDTKDDWNNPYGGIRI